MTGPALEQCASRGTKTFGRIQCCLPLVRILPTILGVKTKKIKRSSLQNLGVRNHVHLICRAASYKSVCCDLLLAKVCWSSWASTKVYSRLERHKQ